MTAILLCRSACCRNADGAARLKWCMADGRKGRAGTGVETPRREEVFRKRTRCIRIRKALRDRRSSATDCFPVVPNLLLLLPKKFQSASYLTSLKLLASVNG